MTRPCICSTFCMRAYSFVCTCRGQRSTSGVSSLAMSQLGFFPPFLFTLFLCMSVCMHMYAELKVRAKSFILFCGFWGSNSGSQAWQQAPSCLPAPCSFRQPLSFACTWMTQLDQLASGSPESKELPNIPSLIFKKNTEYSSWDRTQVLRLVSRTVPTESSF